jgi:abortive infection bacteriophage resistance protein
MSLKPALSVSQQLNILRQRGMNIDDEVKATIFLESTHYYRLNIYFHKFMDSPNHYQAGMQFSQIMAVYENDRWLRNKILSVLEQIEIETRTRISHHLALTYGSDAFYQHKIFKDRVKYQEILRIFANEISRNKKDPVVVHHQNIYGGLFPIWVVVEFFSFNTLSKFYKNLLESDKKIIAKSFYNVNDYLYGQWLHVLSIQRNICAHYGYLFRREYPIRPIIAKSFNWDSTKDNNLFATFLVLRRLSNPAVWQTFIETISDNEKELPFFHLEDYGFPVDWRSYLS